MTRSTNPDCFHLSASCIQAYKACPTRFRLSYREGLRVAEDTDALRIGTNWHALHEVYRNAFVACTHDDIGTEEQRDEHCLNAVVEDLNSAYDQRPGWKTPLEWDLERHTLLTCFLGYLWYFQDDDIEYLHQELAFDLPVHAPQVGLPLPLSQVKRVGKIDHIVRWKGMVGPIERKSTTRGIGPTDDYWMKLRKDSQVSMYALAILDMVEAGELPVDVKEGENLGNTLYDVWKRPLTKPKELSQANTTLFLESGEYMKDNFQVTVSGEYVGEDGNKYATVKVNDVDCEVKGMKKGFAIRETVEMYCARLLEDIYEAPEKFYQRREIPRSQAELRKFRVELYNIYQMMRVQDKTGAWFENENQCRATFPCPHIPICYGEGADAACDGKTIPSGFKRVFVDLTVEGQGPSEDE